MNITLSVDEKTLLAARKVAAAMGKSLNEIIREDLERLTRQSCRASDLAEFKDLSKQGDSQDWQFNRDDLYQRP